MPEHPKMGPLVIALMRHLAQRTEMSDDPPGRRSRVSDRP
jgi:hypothetical protein